MSGNSKRLLAALAALSCFTHVLRADTDIAGGVEWTYSTSGGAATIISAKMAEGGGKVSGEIAIPSELGGCSVKTLGAKFSPEALFDGCTGLTGVTIPDSVEAISDRCFNGCTALAKVEMGAGVRTLGKFAFQDCKSLAEISLGAKIAKLEQNTFYNCESLQNVELPPALESIGQSAFALCRKLSGLQIPGTVASIGANAFEACEALGAVELPEGVAEIPSRAFYGCTSLVELKIPATCTAIGEFSFSACTNLQTVIVGENVSSIGDYAFGHYASAERGAALQKVVFLGATAPAVGNYIFGKYGSTRYLPDDCTVYVRPGSSGWLNTQGKEIDLTTLGPYSVWQGVKISLFDATVGTVATFDACGGVASESERIVWAGDALGALPTATLSGYDLAGWFTEAEGGEEVSAETIVAEDTTYYAQWKDIPDPKSLEIIGADSVAAGASAKYIARVTLIDDTTRDIAAEWSVAEGGDFGEVDDSGTLTAGKVAVSGTVSLKATWTLRETTVEADAKTVEIEPRTVAVSFSAEDADDETPPEPVELTLYGPYGELPAVSRATYSFAGWATKQNGDPVAAEDILEDGVTTLYAQWEELPPQSMEIVGADSVGAGESSSYSVTVEFSDGASRTVEDVDWWIEEDFEPSDEEAWFEPSDIEEDGAFTACETPYDGTVKIGASIYIADVELEVFKEIAVTPRKATVTFDFSDNGATETREMTIYSALGEFPGHTRAGYVLDHWEARETGGAVRIVDAGEIVEGDARYYAVWRRPAVASLEIAGDDSMQPGEFYVFSATATYEDGTQSVVGLKNAQWYISESDVDIGWDEDLDSETGAYIAVLVPSGVKTERYAVLGFVYYDKNYNRMVSTEKTLAILPRPVEVTLHGNGGSPETTNMVFYAYTEYDGLPGATRAGYNRIGWWTTAEDTDEAQGERVYNSTYVDPDVTDLYSRWEENTSGEPDSDEGNTDPATIVWYKVNFNAVGGRGGESRTIASGEKFVTLPEPVRQGWAFDGWWTARVGGEQITGDSRATASTTYYAHWIASSVQIPADPSSSGGGSSSGGDASSGGDGSSDASASGGSASEASASGDSASDNPGAAYELDDIKSIYSQTKRTVLDGALYNPDGSVAGTIQLKIGKPNSRYYAKVSGTITPTAGKKVSLKAVSAYVPAAAPVSAVLDAKGLGTLSVRIQNDAFAGRLGDLAVSSAAVGGQWTREGVFALDPSALDSVEWGATIRREVLPLAVAVHPARGGKWTFDKASKVSLAWDSTRKDSGLSVNTTNGRTNTSALRLTYVPSKGTFKGSFKMYAIENNRLKRYSVKVSGIVVDGVGYGTATATKPGAATFGVSVK